MLVYIINKIQKIKDTSAQQFQISTKMLTEVIEPKGANNLYGEKIKIKST